MRLLAKGKSLSEIADTFCIAYEPVADACPAIKQKLSSSQAPNGLMRVAMEMQAS